MCPRRISPAWQLLAAVLLSVLALFASVNGQYAKVKQVSAETTDGLRFTARLKQQTVRVKQEVTIGYEIQNHSNKPTYLVQKEGPVETSIDGDALNLPFVIVSSGDSSSYQYRFTKIEPAKNHSGEVVVPAGRLNKDQVWIINLAFGYVSDINGLDRKLAPKEDPAPFRGLLEERLLLVQVNGLTVDVNEP